jgi:hypothetical protein
MHIRPSQILLSSVLLSSVLAVAAFGLIGCVGAPEHCNGCLAALADAGILVPPKVDAAAGTGGRGVETGGVTGSGGGTGTGGTASGGSAGTGGVIGTGGAATGGRGVGGAATGGTATGGAATGGRGTGGATGGMGTGGAATGGTGTGGAATGGMGTGGAATGGRGTGGAATGGAGPRILSIDFVGGIPNASGGAGGTTLTPVPMLPADVAGVKPVANWNSAGTPAGTRAALVGSDGTATTASVTWNSPAPGQPGIYGLGFTNTTTGNAKMMNGYLDPTDATMPATITVSGLPTSITTGGYDVYVYMLGNMSSGTRTYKYAIGAATTTVSQTGASPTAVPAFVLAPNNMPGNYFIFRNVTGAAFTLTATPGTGTPRAPVNGIQIVSPTGS